MARKRKDQEEVKVYNGGGVGYSQAALERVMRGTYGTDTGRKPQYHTSQEQLEQAKSLPVLEGLTRSNSFNNTNSSRPNYVNTDRARQKYAERNNYTPLGQEEPIQSSDENYVVKRERYDKLMQNGRLANDIKTLAEVNYLNADQDATVSQEWADEYGAKKITGGYTKSQFINTLSRRYDLTPKELNDMALTFHSDANKKNVENYSKQLEKIGENHSVLGSAGSFVGTLGSGIEGAYNTAVGALTGDDRYLSDMFRTTKNSLREGAKKNIKSNLGKGAYDIGMGIGDMAAGSAAGSAPVILAGNTANEAQASARQRGSSVRKSSIYGGAAGVLDFVTNKVGLDKAKKLAVESIKSTGLKKFLAKNAIAGLAEGGENVLQDIGQSFLDLINGGNAELIQSYNAKKAKGLSDSDAFKETAKEYAAQLGLSAGIGFGMGSAMQAGTSAIPQLRQAYGNMKNNKLADRISANPDVQRIVDGKVPEVTSDADLQRAQSQQSEAVNEINRLSKQIPEAPVDFITGLRQSFAEANPEQKADMLVKGGYFRDMIEAGEAFQAGKLDAAVEDYLTRMERNGDPTPTKATTDKNRYDHKALDEKYGGDWEQMRRGTIKEYTGVDDSTADKYYDVLRRFVGGSMPQKTDAAIIDEYISKAPTYDGQITRGMHFNLGDGSYDDFMSKIHEGDTVTLGKPSSWASDPESARVYSHMGDDNTDSIEIVCNQNRTSSPIDFINGQGEDEVVSPSNAAWTVLKEETYTRPNGARKTILHVAETAEPVSNAKTIPEEGTAKSNVDLAEQTAGHLSAEEIAALEKDAVDNNTLSGYNDVTKGEAVYGTEQRAADNVQPGIRENIAGNRQSDLSRSGGMDEEQGMLGRGDNRVSEQYSVTPEMRQKMDAANITNYGLKPTTDAMRFSMSLNEGRKSENNTHGVFVSAKSPEEVQEIIDNGGKVFLTDDNTAGLIVTADGDIEGVFNNSALAKSLNKQGKAFSDLMVTAIANGGTKLDCYGEHLAHLYARVGFEPVAGSKYLPKREWSAEMDAWKEVEAKKKGLDSPDKINTDVYIFKLRDGWTADDAIEALKTGSLREYADNLDLSLDAINKDLPQEYSEIPEDDLYGALLDYRDSLMDYTINEDIGLNGDSSEFVMEGEAEPREPFVQDGRSRVVTKSAINANIISRYDYDNSPILQEISKYAKANNETSYNNALENVKNHGETLLSEYNNGTRAIDNDQDVDQAMILLQNLSDQLRAGENVEAERNLLLSRLRAAGTKWGQNIQAFAKWNDTPDGALINGEKINAARAKEWEETHQKQAEANRKAAEELVNITNGGDYSTPKAKNPETASSARLDRALREQGYDGTMEKAPKAPKTHEQHRIEVENSIRKELGSIADQFTNNDFEFLTSLVENKVPIETIIDEIEHKLNHGEWYTIDESTPVKKATSSKLAKVLKNMGDDSRKSKNIVPELKGDIEYPKKSRATIENEVRNTLADDPAAVDLDTPEDVDFIATMLENKVPEWQIEDEISHRLMFGEWYELDNSVEAPKPISQKLQNALNSLVEEEVKPEKPVLTHEELREQVKNTLDKEMASMGLSRLYTSDGEYTDADIDYLTNLIENGATKQELAQALNTKMATGTFAISQETQAKVNELFEYANQFDPDSKEACEAKAAAYKLIADEVVGDADALDKFEAWRYLAMLGNPKTIIRNFVGNTMFNALTDVSNGLAGALEAGVDKLNRSNFAKSNVGQKLGLTGNGIQRTKSLLMPTSKDKGLVKAAWNDALAHRYKEISGTKYEKSVKDQISQSKSVFNSKWAKLYEKVTDAGVSDMAAVRTKYSTSLAGYLKSNGIDEGIFKEAEEYSRLKQLSTQRVLTDAERAQMQNAKQSYDTLEKARDYAVKQAEYATFHEDNAVANWLSDMSRKAPGALKWLIEGTIPFKKTPANIVRSGEEYSPFGAINSIAKTGKLIYENTGSRKGNLADTYTTKKGKTVNKTLASDVIESWSKTLTGSGLMMLGYYLKNKGILNSSKDDERYQDELEGKQNYSLTINGHTYTIDWAAPASMALLMGAELSKIAEDNAVLNKSVYDNFSSIVDTVNSLVDPVIETSMMQGIKDTIESAANATQYNDNAKKGLGILGAVGANTALNYATQAIPTLLGQVARVVDPTRRSTDTVAQDPVMSSIEKQGRKTMNKLPFVSMLNNPYVDTRGQEQLNSPSANPLVSIPYQMLSPGYLQKINQTDADKSARAVYNAPVVDNEGNVVPQLDKNVFSQWKSKVTVDGHKLTPDEMYQYRRKAGSADLEIRNALAKEKWFNDLRGERQAEILKKVNNLVDKLGKEAVGYKQSSDELTAYKEGGIPELLDKFQDKQSNKTLREAGLSTTSKKAEEIRKDIKAGNTEVAQQKIDQAVDDKSKAEEYGFFKDDGSLNMDAYYNALDYAGDDPKSLKAYSDYRKQGFERDSERIPYLMKNSTFTDAQKGHIIGGHPNKMAKAAKGMYDKAGYEGVWTYYVLKNLADTNGNGRITKAERNTLFNSNNPYVTALSDDQYEYLSSELK